MTTSKKLSATIFAVASSTGFVRPMIPPNEEVGSQAIAFAKASETELSEIAAPHGLACLTTTAANGAYANLRPGLENSLRQLFGDAFFGLHQVQRNPLSGAWPDARKFSQLSDQRTHRLRQGRHHISPGKLNPAVILLISEEEISFAWLSAWFAAVRTISSSS